VRMADSLGGIVKKKSRAIRGREKVRVRRSWGSEGEVKFGRLGGGIGVLFVGAYASLTCPANGSIRVQNSAGIPSSVSTNGKGNMHLSG